MSDASAASVCVFGAGAIGCYLGGRLAAAGTPVTFVGRARIADAGGLLAQPGSREVERLAARRIEKRAEVSEQLVGVDVVTRVDEALST